MPLLRDLPDVLTRANPQSDWHRIGESLNRLLELTDGDIEVLLTFLYRLNESFFAPRRQHLLDVEFLDQILTSSALPEFFTVPDESKQAAAILELLRSFVVENELAVSTFSPLNFFTLFQLAMRNYFQASFQRYPCPLHLCLFESLERFDCVVSFNYDTIADHTLHWAGKLTPLSFEGLGFGEIALPPQRAEAPEVGSIPHGPLRQVVQDRPQCVKFLKVHGSFNWFCRMEEGEAPRAD